MARHKTGVGGNCFLWFQRFLASEVVWCAGFSPHGIHDSMLDCVACECGGMLGLVKFTTRLSNSFPQAAYGIFHVFS